MQLPPALRRRIEQELSAFDPARCAPPPRASVSFIANPASERGTAAPPLAA